MNWKSILQKSWKKTLLFGGFLFIIGCIISFFLFTNKMAVVIGLPFWFYEKGAFPWLGDLEDHTIFSTIRLLADMFFWFLIAFFVTLNKKVKWIIIFVLLIITAFTIYSFYIKSKSVQTGAPPSPVSLCETDNDCINVITGDIEGYKAQACVNKNYKNYNLQPYDYPGKILSETGEDRCRCLQWQVGETKYKTCEFKQGIDTSNWQTYQNEEYGFEVKFPSDLVLQKNTGEAYTSFLGKLVGESYFLQFGYISENTLNTMGINYCQAYPNDSRCENFSPNSLKFLIDWNIETEGVFTQSRAEILKPEGGMVIISILHSPGQDIKSFFRQILSTFKFTE